MKISITKEKQNPFMKRKEMEISIEHTGEATPALNALEAILEKELNEQKEKIDIRNIFSDKGKPFSKSKVFVWDDKKPEKKAKKDEGGDKSVPSGQGS